MTELRPASGSLDFNASDVFILWQLPCRKEGTRLHDQGANVTLALGLNQLGWVPTCDPHLYLGTITLIYSFTLGFPFSLGQFTGAGRIGKSALGKSEAVVRVNPSVGQASLTQPCLQGPQ